MPTFTTPDGHWLSAHQPWIRRRRLWLAHFRQDPARPSL